MVGKSARAHWSHDGSGFPLDKEKTKTERRTRTSLAASDAPLRDQEEAALQSRPQEMIEEPLPPDGKLAAPGYATAQITLEV